MSRKDIKKFLPPIFKTKEITNFLDSTTNKLFEEKQSERINYYIGKKIGGVYEHLYDPYAEETSKLREDYQLEASLVERDEQSGDVNSVLFYEDLLNSLKSGGSFTDDQSRLFSEDVYSFAPPIDIDMFINYRDYYWMPEGAPAIEIDAMPTDIIGNINYSGLVMGVNEQLTFTTGNHVILNDGKEYIVDGVGVSIRLTEFDLSNNTPIRVERAYFVDNLSLIEKFPKEYITMERGSYDQNTWSRNNSWYHRDALFPAVSTRPETDISRDRQALRPIIQFIRNIELYNYSDVALTTVDVMFDGTTLPNDEIDDVSVFDGMRAIKNNSGNVFTYDQENDEWSSSSNNKKIVVTDGRTKKSTEVIWKSSTWNILQPKTADTQAILFNMYDGMNDDATLLDTGNPIFTYKEDEDGLFDSELNLFIEQRMSGDSSDYTFINAIRQYAEENEIVDISFKMPTSDNLSERTFTFTIGEFNGRNDIFVNDDHMPTIVLTSGMPYIFDYSDSSTTALGWFERYSPITILDSDGEQVIRPTHGHSSNTRVTFEYTLEDNESQKEFFYQIETNQEVMGKILVVDDQNVSDVKYYNEFRYKGIQYTNLLQRLEIEEDGVSTITLEYQPLSDDITVMLNGEDTNDYTFSRRQVSVSGTVKGQLLEVRYNTRERIDNDEHVIQEAFPSLTNNAVNDDPLEFSFSDIFNHLGSIIRNQRDITGTALGTNNYRDSEKDISRGDIILKHSSSMLPLMFINKNDNLNLIEALEHSSVFYTQYKNNIVLRAEEYQRNNDINVDNTRDIFDDIISDLNAAKQSSDSFAGSFMFASYKNYVNVSINDDGVIQENINLQNTNNSLYVYTNNGLRIIDEDYTIDYDGVDYIINNITFSLSDISILRYYDDVQPTFCPATPAKFGIVKPVKPTLEIDDTYLSPKLILVGHDNSRTLAYTSIDSFNNNEIDGRDLVMLEFENRIYNGIQPMFKRDDVDVIQADALIAGKFRETEYSRDEYIQVEYEKFFKWSTVNMADYTTNLTYVEGNPFTYNYSSNVDKDGETLQGHWKGIYEYYYDTTTPHTTPWEMLGFAIKPVWFDDEYGTDYGSLNVKLWKDLEEGIIRQGARSNVESYSYLNDNPYRRIGLSSVIPVDSNGSLLSPIGAGITEEPRIQDAKRSWKFGDNGPVEQAWKMMSDYQYSKLAILYVLKPALITVNMWDTETTISETDLYNVNVNNFRVHGEDGHNVLGISQWIHDLLVSDNLTPNDEMIVPFRNLQINLSHKVGGFVNADELRLYSESYNPNSDTISTLMPYEDVSVRTHQSKDVRNEAYSGVVVERVEASRSYFAYVEGYVYQKDDIIFDYDDGAYYKKTNTIKYDEWERKKDYFVGDEVLYNNSIFVCIQDNTSSNIINPENDSFWKLKPFNSGEWAILINPPKTNKTEFKVYGYNVRSPYFPVSIPLAGAKKKSVNITTSNSSPINANAWRAGQYYLRGHVVVYNSDYYEADVTHTSGNSFDSDLWIRWSTIPTQGDVRVTYSTESSGDVDTVEYGQRFKRLDDVVEFLASYGRGLEDRGWIFNDYDNDLQVTKNWDYIIKEFVRWSVDYKDVGAAITLSPFSNKVNYNPKHGVVSLINQFKQSAFNLLDHRSGIIPVDSTNVTRVNNQFTLESPLPVYFIRLGVREYEHSITINNTTIFDDSNYDPLLGIRKDRLRISGTKSLEWNGTLNAPGYIITDEGMVPNFDTVANELLHVNDMDSVATKDVINELKYHNVGYQKRSYLENLEMTDKSQINFYQGFIRQKGTTEAFQRLLRSNIIDANDTLDISEEWAFREGIFGSTYNELQTEFYVESEDFNFNPQHLNLVYDNNNEKDGYNITNVNINNPDDWIMKPNRFRVNGKLWKEIRPVHEFKSAGYVQFNEHELKSPTMAMLNNIMVEDEIVVEEGLTTWIGYNEMTHGSWDVLLLDDDGQFIGEIYNHGNDDENSAVVKAYNVEEDELYVLTHSEGFYNVTFKYIKDGYYLILSHDEDEYVILNPNDEYMDLSIYRWKSLRIIPNHVEETIDDVETHIDTLNITPVEGMLIYADRKRYDDESWYVYQYQNDEWSVIRTPRDVIDISLFNDVVAYDDNDEIIDYVRPFDPLQGFIPGSLLHEIDSISDEDPVSYNTREYATSRYSQMEGFLWLNTKEMIYVDYHQGDVEYRKTHWGSLFPNSDVSVYEWTKSTTLPENYDGEVYSTTNYITQQVFEDNLGIYKTYYYFWVKNPVSVPSMVNRKSSANDISQSIKYPYNNGIPLLAVMDNHSVSIMDNSRRLIMNDVIMRINYKYQHTNVQSHTQWRLIDESTENDTIPTFIFGKMIDSILGYDENMLPVPDTSIPESSRYGAGQGQTWFVDLDAARKVFFENINEFISKLNIWDIELFWERLYGGIDTNTNLIEFIDWYDDSFDPSTVIVNLVSGRIETTLIPIENNEYVKVIEPPSKKPSMRNGGWTIFQYVEEDDTFKKVGQSNATIEFNVEEILTNGIDENEVENLRHIINVVFENFAVRPYHHILNNILFSMTRTVMAEQPNNNWLFPSTYIKARQDLVNLVPRLMYRLDKEAELREYIREAKPYHTKLRSFEKVNRPNDELVQMKVTDFDKPPHIDQDKNFFILQERFIDKIEPNGTDTEFYMDYGHTTNVRVTLGDTLVQPDEYDINGRFITFNEAPEKDKNLVPSIVVESDNVIHRNIIQEWNPTYGYRILDNTRDQDVWDELAINKHVEIHYDRNSHTNLVALEKLIEIYDYAFEELDEPYAYLDSLSDLTVDDNELLREIDRVLIYWYIDDVKDVVSKTYYKTISGTEDYFYEVGELIDDELVLINDEVISKNLYDLIEEDNQTIIRFKFEPLVNDYIVVRPRTEYLSLMKKVSHYKGMNVQNESPILVPEDSNYCVVDLDDRTSMLVEHDDVIEINNEVLVFEHDTDSDVVISGGTFGNDGKGYPEEKSELHIHETMVFMCLNHLPPLVKMGYDTIGEKIIQPTHAFTVEEDKFEYLVDIMVPSEQVKVIINDDVLTLNVHYEVFNDRIRLIRSMPIGDTLVVTDLYSNFDMNYHNNVKRIKNINGGYDSFVFDYSRITESPVTREFIAYTKDGLVHYLKANDNNYLTVNEFPDMDSDNLLINEDVNDMDNRLFAMVGFNRSENDEHENVDYEIVRGSVINNQLTYMTRGLFTNDFYDFSNKEEFRLYELHVEDDLENFVIQEKIIGVTGRNSYPKYGNIFN